MTWNLPRIPPQPFSPSCLRLSSIVFHQLTFLFCCLGQAARMFECEECGDEFWYHVDLTDHLEDYDHWRECETCTRIFTSQRACNQHMDDTNHWAPRYECETCTREFMSQSAANQHMNAVGHWAPKVPCESCSKKFHTQQAADQHMKAWEHFKNYCRTCDRRFMNENNLRAVITMSCPFPGAIDANETYCSTSIPRPTVASMSPVLSVRQNTHQPVASLITLKLAPVLAPPSLIARPSTV